MERSSVSIPELENDPLSDGVLDFLIDHDSEEAYLDFKQTLSINKDGPFSEIAKDLLAFCNYGGGLILVGYRDKMRDPIESRQKGGRQYIPIGLGDDYHIDQANLQVKFNSFCITPITLGYREYHRSIEGNQRRFAAIYVPPSTELMKAAKGSTYTGVDGRKHNPFEVGQVLVRRGTQSVPATRTEIQFILRRISDTQYRLSILSGQPDRIKETVFSNLFETTIVEGIIFEGVPRQQLYGIGSPDKIPDEYISKRWGKSEVTFENLDNPGNPLWRGILTDSIQRHELNRWLQDQDRSRVIIALLNKELGFLSRRIGLFRLDGEDRYYFPCDGESRKVTWRPRFRESSELMVAKKVPIPKLRREVYIHLAANTGFIHFENRIYLGLFPTLMLTEDGRKPTIGEKEGAVLTSLLHNRYNQAFLNDLLFWIQQFSQGNERIELAHGRVLVSSRPTESSVGVGILSDRPVSDGVPEHSPQVESS